MVWGCVSFDCKMDLIDIRGNLNGRRYVDEILEPHVEPHMDNHALNDRPIFMQDGATPHTARISQGFLHDAAIDVMLWPSKSPDLNIIENLWSHISRSINALPERPRNAAQLRDAVHDKWRALSQARVQRLVRSLHRRVRAVVEADGGHIPYWGPCCWSVSLVTSLRIKSCIHISVLSLSYAANKDAIFFIIFNVFHYIKFPKIWFVQNNFVQS